MKVFASKNLPFLHGRLRFVRRALMGQKPLPKKVFVFPEPVKKAESVKVGVSAEPQPSKKPSSHWYTILFVFFTAASILLMTVLFGPAIYDHFFPPTTVALKPTTVGTPLGGRFDKGTQTPSRQVVLPPKDDSLPDGEWLIIPSIGVNTEIQENTDSAVALEKGVWRVPDYGQPGDTTKPIILAAHRYGYIWWWRKGSQYWKYNSFYLLPQLQPGDLIEVISDKRKYEYEVYAGEKGTEITDYNADMILYTCEFLNGDTRYFRYARLLDPGANTQTTARTLTK